MTASAKERQKAAYIRGKGAKATPSQKQWLQNYIAKHKARPADDKPAAVEPPASPLAAAPVVDKPPEKPPEAAPAGQAPVAFDTPGSAAPVTPAATSPAAPGAPPAPSATTPHVPTDPTALTLARPPTCGKADCPACSKNVGGAVCAATGVVIWDPIDMDAAIGIGDLFFLGVMGAVKFMRKDGYAPMPTASEEEKMGKAIQLSVYRRLNALGAYSDILLFATVLGKFTVRAVRAPAPVVEKKDVPPSAV